MQDRPFALVGVNSDDDKDSYREQLEATGVNWRSAWQGSPDGPIPSLWGVQGWPTLYLIDHEGVIRGSWVGNPGDELIDAQVTELVEQAERADAGD